MTKPEQQTIEYKQSWHDECLKWICGFANAQGGTLVVGRDDRGVAVGVDNARKLMVDLPNKIRATMGVVVDVNLRSENELDLFQTTKPKPTL